MGEGAFAYEFSPVARVGENLFLIPLNRYVTIKYIEPIPGKIIDFGSLDAGESTPTTELTDMEMPEDEIGQYRIKVLDDITVTVYQKRGVGRFSTKNVLYPITPDSDTLSSHANSTEIFVYGDDAPWVQVTNSGTVPILKSRIWIQGFRYVVETLEEAPAKYTAIPIWGWGARGD